MKFEVIDTQSHKWDEYVKSAHTYDFHHTSVFHEIEAGDNSAKLFVAYDGKTYVCLPLIIRPIQGTDLYDATSVYGYSGPISSVAFSKVPNELFVFFQGSLVNYCQNQNIISVFSRLHPCIEQPFALGDLGQIINLNKTVSIDLTMPVDVQRQGYSRSYKHQINKLKRKNYSISVESSDYLDVFKDIYFETMDRVGASQRYYFSDDYLHKLMKNACFDTYLLIAYNASGEPVSAALFTVVDKIMQYHLGGTTDAALVDAPIKYIMDEARLLANQLGLKTFHLGGGLGGRDDDPLFRFKKGFSKTFCQFKVWNWIVNQTKYDQLVVSSGLDKQTESQFFPLYRMAG